MKDFYCPFCNRVFATKNAWCSHKGKCKENPLYIPKPRKPIKPFSEEHKLKIKEGVKKAIESGKKYDGSTWLGRRHTEEQKQKISTSMKKAHAEGRAHNIGECRWNNQPSYPEQWFMRVLKNEFGLEKDKDYKMEFSFHKFSLDFAWPDKKLCIEIDGDQHKKFQKQKNRDIEKDRLLKEEGWTELRKPWKEIFNNPKTFIEEVGGLLK